MEALGLTSAVHQASTGSASGRISAWTGQNLGAEHPERSAAAPRSATTVGLSVLRFQQGKWKDIRVEIGEAVG
jgi:hypothetical protein